MLLKKEILNRTQRIAIMLLFFAIFLSGVVCNGQFYKRPLSVEIKGHSGIVLPLYRAISYLVEDDIYAFDMAISFPAEGKDFWEKKFNYPRPGIGYSYWSLGNDEIFGRAHALYSFINIPFTAKKDKLYFSYQVSFGASYLTKPFDLIDNHLNRAIGSHLNAYIRLGIDGKIKISPSGELVVGAGGAHFSNGKTKSPNYGINAATFSLGVNYLFNRAGATVPETDEPEIGKRYVHSVLFSGGFKVYDNLLGRNYFLSSVTYNIEKKISQITKLGAGADLFYDSSIREAMASPEGLLQNDISVLLRAGLHVSYSAQYKKVMAGLQVGYYIYNKYTVFTSVYNRISIKYFVTNNVIGTIGIKSHMGKADCLEWGLGYTW